MGFVVEDNLNELNEAQEQPANPSCSGVSDGDQVHRVMVYVGTSADQAQRAHQLVLQQAAANRYAAETGLDVVRVSAETGVAEPGKPARDRLMKDAASDERDFDYVLVGSFPRISRKGVELFNLVRTLDTLGVKVVSLTDSMAEVEPGVSLEPFDEAAGHAA